MIFQDMIKELRLRKGLTQRQLAERIGVSYQAVSRWEKGLDWPAVTKLSKLASVLDTSIDALLNARHGVLLQERPPAPKTPAASSLVSLSLVDRASLPSSQVTSGAALYQCPMSLFQTLSTAKPPFLVRADGDQVASAGITDGDLLIINPAESPAQGALALVSVYNTLSARFVFQRPDGVLLADDQRERLIPPPEVFAAAYTVVGVVCGVIKSRPRPRRF